MVYFIVLLLFSLTKALLMGYHVILYLNEICNVLIDGWRLDKFPYPTAEAFDLPLRLENAFR